MKRVSMLPAGLSLAGDVEGDEDLVVAGAVEGSVRLDADLVIEAGGSVRGDVHARAVVVRGVLAGDAWGSRAVRVDAGARMVGDATAPRVKIVEGALFRGQVHIADEDVPRAAFASPKRVSASASAPTVPGTAAAPATRPGDATAPGSESVPDARSEPASAIPPGTATTSGSESVPEAADAGGEPTSTAAPAAMQADSEEADAPSVRRAPPPARMPVLRRARGRRRGPAG